jgi:PhzF family phenazine biosynthesis protein
MRLPIYQVDAFASKPFTGNPAAVVPLEEWIEEGMMQNIAMENNLSETAFFVKDGDHYHLRWFTPTGEIDLCGHATLASAYVIKNFLEPHVQDITFTTEKAGVLRTLIKEGKYTLDFPSRKPVAAITPETLLKALGITSAVEILKARDYFVVLPDEQAVRHIEPDFGLMKEIEDAFGVIVTAKGREVDVVSRCFYPKAGIPEDPVTGSAHCNLVPYWAEKLGKTHLECRQLSPRGGELQCELAGSRVLMSGNCVLYLQGQIHLR